MLRVHPLPQGERVWAAGSRKAPRREAAGGRIDMAAIESLGFVGLGRRGEPMCANLARKSGLRVYAADRRADPLQRLAAEKVSPCASVAELAHRADLIFLSLPSGREVEEVCLGAGGIAGAGGRVRTVVDCGTSPVALTRALAARLAAAGIDFADAPVARTPEAAQQGQLSIMVGAAGAEVARAPRRGDPPRPWAEILAGAARGRGRRGMIPPPCNAAKAAIRQMDDASP